MFLNLFARETRGENAAIFVTSLGRMENLSFCRNSILWYQRMLVGYSELWATVELRVNDRVNYAIYLSRSSPTLLSPDSLGKFHYGDVTESKGSRLARNTRNALTAPRKYWGLEIARGICSYTAVSRNVHATILKGIVDGFDLHCSTKKFERMAQEVTDICSRALMESNKSKEQCNPPFWDCRVHIFFRQPFSKLLCPTYGI